MTFSPAERRKLLEEVAAQALAEIRAEVGSLAELAVLPLSAAGPLLGLSAKSIPRHLPVIELTPGKLGVTVAAIRHHLRTHTRSPK